MRKLLWIVSPLIPYSLQLRLQLEVQRPMHFKLVGICIIGLCHIIFKSKLHKRAVSYHFQIQVSSIKIIAHVTLSQSIFDSKMLIKVLLYRCPSVQKKYYFFLSYFAFIYLCIVTSRQNFIKDVLFFLKVKPRLNIKH